MSEYTLTEQKIEEEYQLFVQNPAVGIENLYCYLFPYLKNWLIKRFSDSIYLSEETAEDLIQESMIYILEEGIHKFQSKDVYFAKWCRVVVKNRFLDYFRKQRRNQTQLLEEERLDQTEHADFLSDVNQYHSPERILMELEYKMEQCERLKSCLEILMEQVENPHQTVSCCYTLVLYHRYHPDSKRNSSPEWAYQEVAKETVESSARRFLAEMSQWMPHLKLDWKESFWREMEKMRDGRKIGQVVYGEHFKWKDFENWSYRIRRRVCIQYLERQDETGLDGVG